MAMRDSLRQNPLLYRNLDAAQLVKHDVGLSTEVKWVSRLPELLYLYAGPAWGPAYAGSEHRTVINRFSAVVVRAARVLAAAASWTEWLARFVGRCSTCGKRTCSGPAPEISAIVSVMRGAKPRPSLANWTCSPGNASARVCVDIFDVYLTKRSSHPLSY